MYRDYSKTFFMDIHNAQVLLKASVVMCIVGIYIFVILYKY